MNWLDILLIIIGIVILFFGVVALVLSVMDDEIGTGIGMFVLISFVAFMFGMLPFIHLDKGSGFTIGIITSVDKNFFGTTAVYIKTSETTQEKYCIEFNEELEEEAKKNIGKRVKIEYGERVGFYSTGKCSQAPIEKIIEVTE